MRLWGTPADGEQETVSVFLEQKYYFQEQR